MIPRLLLLETSHQPGVVALAEGEHVLAEMRLDEARRHARDLVPATKTLLERAGWAPRDLTAAVVSIGPGSYTGLRVGIMSAKSFAYATGAALLAIDTFAAIASQAPAEVVCVDVIADAQQDKVYVQRFGRSQAAAGMQPASPLRIQPFPEWLTQREAAIGVTGPGLRVHGRRLATPQDQVLNPELWDPQPPSLLNLGLARYAAGERDEVWTLEPLYLRPSSAEEKWDARDPTGPKPKSTGAGS
jgi:tRNA threonylcarbamoyladenosine biosynthesis protein TsaB